MPSANLTLPNGRRARVSADTPEQLEAVIAQAFQDNQAETPQQSQVDTTPTQIPQRFPPAQFGHNPMGNLPATRSQEIRTSPQEREAAAAGVDIGTGSPVGRLQSGFAQNEAIQAQDLRRRLSQHFGQDIPVRLGPRSGKLEFLNPETNRFTLVNEAQGTIRDVLGGVGPALPVAGAVVGEIAGAPFGPAGAITGAAVGGGTGENIRRVVGNLMGVRDESTGDILQGAAGTAALEGGFAAGGEVVARGAQGIRNIVRPRPVSPEHAAQILFSSESAQQVADQISQRTGQQFQPFTGQLSNDAELLGAQSTVMADRNSAVAARQQQSRNETALETLFDQIMPAGDTPNSAIGRGIQNEARDQTQPRVNLLSDGVQRQMDELEQLTASLPRAQNARIGESIREMAETGRETIKEFEQQAWTKAEEMYGLNSITNLSNYRIPVTDELENTVMLLRTEAKESLDPARAAGKRELASDRLLPYADDLSDSDRELLEAFDALDGSEEHSLDLHQVQSLLSSLRDRQRISMQGRVATDPVGRDLTRLEHALVIQRNNYLRETAPDVLAQIELAESISARRANLFDKGVVGGILRQQDGSYGVTNPEVVGRTIASGNPDAIRHLVAVYSDHPAGVATLQDSMLQYYRNQVVRDGIPDGALHRRFIENNGDALDALFPVDQARRIRQLGELERVVTANKKRFARFEEAVQRSFRGRIQDLAPERVVEQIFTTGMSEKEVAHLMRLAEAAGYDQPLREAVGQSLQTRFISRTSGINLPALSKYVANNRAKLSAVFGPQYTQDMDLLLKGLETARTSGSGIQTTRNPTLWEGFARATVARPLSPTGVALTRAQSWTQWAGRELMAQAVMDPQALHAIVRQGKRDLYSREVTRLLAVLGTSTLVAQQEE